MQKGLGNMLLGQRALYIFDRITKEAILAITGMRKIIIEC